MRRPFRSFLLAAAAVSPLAACGLEAPEPPASAVAPAVTNRIPLPAEVVANLGITFEKATRGRLEKRLRIPGRVEIAPEARYAVRAPASGRVVVRATRWARVRAGDVLGDLLSPELRSAQDALAEALHLVARTEVEIRRIRAEAAHARDLGDAADAALAAARDRIGATASAHESAQALERAARDRVDLTRRQAAENALPGSTVFAAQREHGEALAAALAAARTRDEARADVPARAAEAAVARARAETIGLEIAALERKKSAGESACRQHLRALAALTGLSAAALDAGSPDRPAWLALETVPLRAPADGVVVEIAASDGEWVESSAVVVRVVDPSRVVFRGDVPESDAGRIPPGASARVEIACARCDPVETALSAPFSMADPRTRTVALELRLPGDGSAYPDGASATASLLLDRSTSEEVLLPAACVVQDDLETIVFRRDPAQPGQVIRTVVSVGRRAEGRVEILSEVAEGDEVVRDGVHQLRLTGIGKAPATGHFHADGTWHEGKD